MKFTQIEPRRMLFEKILPSLARKLDIPTSSTYQDIIIGIFEYMAEQREIKRYVIYKFNNFLGEIRNIDIKEKRSKFSRESIFEKIGEDLLKAIKH